MKTKKWILSVCIIAGVIVLCIVGLLASAGIMSAKGYGISVGRLYLFDTEFYLVDEGKAMIMSDQSNDKKLFDGLNTGDLILVIHDGVDESYPARTGAHKVFRLSKGNENNLPENLDIGVAKMDGTADILNASPIGFNVQYIRTDGYREDVEYPIVKTIRSVQELKAYYEANKNLYSLERRENPASDNTIGFLDACDKYNEAYFENQILVMVLLEEGSGSNRHNVDNVKIGSDDKLYVSISSIIPESGTCDMAEWHILIEPEKGIDVKNESDIIVLLDGINPLTQPRIIYESGAFSNITLTIPRGWKYETEHGKDSVDYCISFWPENQTDGKIKVWYYDAFGVCGTGLKQDKITLGDYEACKGTYDNKKVWDFISLIGKPGNYVIMNEGADKWWSEYGNEAMQILNTLIVGNGFISESEAIAIAKQKATVEYDQTQTSYDSENGLWTVSLSKKNTLGGNQDITITYEGKVIDIQYGE